MDEDNVNHVIISQVDLLIKIRTRKIDRLKKAYKKLLNEHADSIDAVKVAAEISAKSVVDGSKQKQDMQQEILGYNSNITRIGLWLEKEKEVDKNIEDKHRDLRTAENVEEAKCNECFSKKEEYFSAEKNLEKMKLLKDHLNGNENTI